MDASSCRRKGALGLLVMLLVLVCVTQLAASPSKETSAKEAITLRVATPPYLEEDFQRDVALIGLERLGYKKWEKVALDGGTAIIMAVSQGDADFTTNYWDPLHTPIYANAGGDAKLSKVGILIKECLQGLLIDKTTADKYGITRLDQFRDPAIAKLFDNDGDGKADLIGGSPGWGSTKMLDYQLQAFGVQNTITHHQGTYFAMVADVIERYKRGEPVIYYSWTPMWMNSILVPGKDVVWLEMPGAKESDGNAIDVSVTGGRNYGYPANNVRVCANKAFLDANPVARRFLELVTIPLNDVSAQNLKMHDGEDKPEDVRRHAEEWVAAHEAEFGRWLEQAQAAK